MREIGLKYQRLRQSLLTSPDSLLLPYIFASDNYTWKNEHTHTHTHTLLSAHSFVKDLYKDEEFPHFIIYNQLLTGVLKWRHLKSSLTPLLPTMVTYLCKRIHNTDFMLIFLNLYFLHFNLTSLIGNSFQIPLQIFIGPTVDGEIMLNINTSIPTTPATWPPLQMSGAMTTLASLHHGLTNKFLQSKATYGLDGCVLGNTLEFTKS